MKLLIVDDESSVLQSLKEAIEPSGYACYVSNNPFEALKILGGKPVDVVISDYQMPDMNGIEFLRKVQQYKPGMPVVLITAYAQTDMAIDAINLGVYSFLKKPIKIKKLMDILKKIEIEKGAKKDTDDLFLTYQHENKILYKEVQHRVKNNLQLVSSLFNLQLKK